MVGANLLPPPPPPPELNRVKPSGRNSQWCTREAPRRKHVCSTRSLPNSSKWALCGNYFHRKLVNSLKQMFWLWEVLTMHCNGALHLWDIEITIGVMVSWFHGFVHSISGHRVSMIEMAIGFMVSCTPCLDSKKPIGFMVKGSLDFFQKFIQIWESSRSTSSQEWCLCLFSTCHLREGVTNKFLESVRDPPPPHAPFFTRYHICGTIS